MYGNKIRHAGASTSACLFYCLYKMSFKRRKDAVYVDTPIPRQISRAKRSRTIPVRGQPIEAYQYESLFRCWKCGDINTTGRDEEDTGKSRMTSTYLLPRQISVGSQGLTPEEAISVNQSIFSMRVAPKSGSNGLARPVKNVFTITAHRGCKSDGTINWTGRF